MLRKPVSTFCLALVLVPAYAEAQSTFGTILGLVIDESGAAVPNAKVTLRDTNENVVAREVTTDSLGNYEIQNLKAGRYELTVSAAGFQKFVQSEIPLLARETVRVNVGLKVGQVKQQVTVEGRPALVSTETQTIASSFGSTAVLELPANFRGAGSTSPYRLLAFLPGVQADNNLNLSIQGGLPHQSEVTVDGISTVNVRSNGPLRDMFPSVEAVAEMRVQGVGNNAEYGQVGDITTTSKGGTNSFHGTLFEYLQNSALDATPFGAVTKPLKVANTFGGSLGGPILKNRTFFFGDFEGMRFQTRTTIRNTVPTAAMRTGNFANEPGTVRDPLTGQPFANSQIPPDRISPVAAKILNFYPLPNFGRTDVEVGSNFRENRPAPVSSNQYDVRIDHVLNSKQSVFGRWTWKDIGSTSPNRLLFPADTNFDNNKSLVFSHNYTISPRLLNEFRFGIARRFVGNAFPLDGPKLVQDLGLQDLGPSFPFNSVPNVSLAGATSDFVHGRPGLVRSQNMQFTNNLTWSKGRHTLKFGADLRRLRSTDVLSFTAGDDYGDFIFEKTFTGNDFADFLLGLPDGTRIARTGPDTDGRVWHYHFFAQDSFKVSPKLTLEYGLRYEYHPPFKDETFNITNFDRTVPITGRVIIPSDPLAKKITAPGFLSSINACPGPPIGGVPCTPFLTAGEAGWPETLRFPDRNNFDPRFGFAYRPFADTRTVIRGGVGVYTMTILGSVFYSLTGIHSSDVTFFQNSLVGGQPLYQWPQTRAGGGISAPVGTQDFRTANAPDFRDPYAIQWHLTAERELGGSTAVRVSYIGMRSVKLAWAPDINQPRPSTTAFSRRPLTDRPFPNWNIIFSRDHGANAIYSALQVEASHRVRSGLTFDSAWTWSKNLADDAGPAPTGFAAENGGGRMMNFYNRRADRGDVAHTRRHRWMSTVIYELPFGRGRRFADTTNGLANAVVGGWHLSSILLWQTGPFLTATMRGGDPSGTGAPPRSAQRPDAGGNGNISNRTADRWWDRAAFVCPGRQVGTPDQFNCNVAPIGRFGNAGVGTLLGPGTVNFSLGFGKDFKITETVRLKFEGSFTNLPNHPNLNDPITNISQSDFGRITSARAADSGGNRVGQFALRLEF